MKKSFIQVSEWGFECKKIHKASMVTSVFMSSMIFTFIGGFIGDKYGRRIICVISVVGLTTASVFSEILITKLVLDQDIQYLIYTISQFFVGIFGEYFRKN